MVRQSGLGKGLSALIPGAVSEASVAGESAPSVGGARLIDVPLAKIRPNHYQPRDHFDDEGLESLAQSIRELGVLQPILLRPGRGDEYELVAGERRWRAARRAGLLTIPAIVRTTDDDASLIQVLVENLQRQDLDALEEAAGFEQMVKELSLTHEEVAQRVGRSRVTVSNALRLLQLSPAIQKLVKDGQLTAGHARALLSVTDRNSQESLARRVVSDQMSVRALEEAVRVRTELAQGRTGKQTSAKVSNQVGTSERPAGLLELEALLGSQLDTKVSIDLGAKRGRIVIDFADLADLERIYLAMAVEADSDESDSRSHSTEA